jgi:thiamine kinase-like enzyme
MMSGKRVGEAATEAERDIEAVIGKVADWRGRETRYKPVVGGISNSNWRVAVAGQPGAFFVKIPGKGTEIFIDRRAANDASRRAAQSGCGPEVRHFLEPEGIEIFDFIEGYRASNNGDFMVPTVRLNAVRALKAFNSAPPLRLTKTCFDMIDEHFRQVRELGGYHPPDFPWLARQYRRARAALEASGLDIVPCMNDTLAGNFLLDDRQNIMLVDFEYASNNDRCYELALWFGEMFFTPDVELELIEEYFGRVDRRVVARITVYKALADIKWSTWAMVQRQLSQLDFDFHKYGLWKHMRARAIMHSPFWAEHLQAL